MIHIGIKGFDKIQARMRELESRIATTFPKVGPDGEFNSALAGLIGETSTAPLNPFKDAMVMRSNVSPAIEQAIQRAAELAGVDPDLLDSLVATESNYNPSARSKVGALGLTQLMPNTAKEMGVDDPLDPIQNLRGGATYLAKMLEKFGGDVKLALAAYNAGPGAVEKHNGIPPFAETQNYVKRVLTLYDAKKAK